jgi:hypothetical protein
MSSTPKSLLKQIARITAMQRGTLCPMRGGRYFNHQTWGKGRNRVRYVPAHQVAALRQAIEGYRRFRVLVEAYADQIIARTRLPVAPPKSSRPHSARPRPSSTAPP